MPQGIITTGDFQAKVDIFLIHLKKGDNPTKMQEDTESEKEGKGFRRELQTQS